MKDIYDFIVIGAGISACTFASCLHKRFSDASILLIENGRRIGGRATTRKSRKNAILEFDHGLPSISFSENISQGIQTLIAPLIDSKKLVDISNDILVINEYGEIDNLFKKEITYRSIPFMKNFCDALINQSINTKKIHFAFETITKSIKRINNLWEIQVNNDKFIKSNNLILSSSLLAHPRCLKILKINTLPLRDALPPGNDPIIDSVIRQTREQIYIKRRVYILYVSSSKLDKSFNNKYLQICFSNIIKDSINFERIIFQKQSDGSMIIVLHCIYINSLIKINTDKLLESLITIFFNHKKFIDLFLHARLLDTMDWRASQPLNNLLPKELQWSSISKVGFCGDWIDFNHLKGVELSMNSSIRLANLLN